MNRLENKVALITGAGSGLGEATARLFHAEGAKLILSDINGDAVQRVAESLPGSVATALDVADEKQWLEVIAQADSEFGKLDILVNNAGVFRVEPLLETSLESYRQVIDTNQVSVFLGMKSAAALMGDSGGGSIVNISSTQGLQGLWGAYGYVGSKFAVRGMTKCAAIELADRNIRVNSVHPGGMKTPMIAGTVADDVDAGMQGQPIKRMADPAEVAGLVLFLASDEASYCTGAEYLAEGGMTCGPVF